MSLIPEIKISEYSNTMPKVSSKVLSVRQASKKYYDKNKFEKNKKAILRKMDRNAAYYPKQQTLLYYKIEIPPKPTKLQTSNKILEEKAQARLGVQSYEKNVEEMKARMAAEAPGGVPPADLSDLSEAQIQEKKDNLVVTQAEMHAGFMKLAENNRIKVKTATGYIDKFDSILEWLGGDSQSNVIQLLKDPEDVRKKIIAGMTAKGLSMASLKDFFTPLMTLCKSGRDYLPAYCLGVDVNAYNKLMGGEMTKKQLQDIERTQTEVAVSYSKISNALTKIRKSDKNSTDHLIVLLYNLVAWRDDVGNLKVFRGDGQPPKTGNHYSVKENKIYLRDYKTAGKYGAKEYPMPDEIKKIFEARDKKTKQSYLVAQSNGEKYKNGKISSMIPKAFAAAGVDERITINTIRHSTVANLYNAKGVTAQQKIDLAYKMNHSTEVAYLTYTRKDFDEEKETIPSNIKDKLKFFDTTRVAKKFDGKVFFGQAGKKDDDGLYPIFYDDEDFEEMDSKEFKAAVALAKKESKKDPMNKTKTKK